MSGVYTHIGEAELAKATAALPALWQLAVCGTPALGANLFHCPHCQHRHWAPRSCGNRHCPRCLAAKSWQWLDKQTRSLLPISYYHCVFTLPAELNSLLLANQRRLYPLLFDCAAQSLLEFGRNRLGGNLGITAVLHTWGQKLDFHPHLHCIVTGGALSPDGKQWRSPKQRKFLFPVQAVAALFRGKFLTGNYTLRTRTQQGNSLDGAPLRNTLHRQRSDIRLRNTCRPHSDSLRRNIRHRNDNHHRSDSRCRSWSN